MESIDHRMGDRDMPLILCKDEKSDYKRALRKTRRFRDILIQRGSAALAFSLPNPQSPMGTPPEEGAQSALGIPPSVRPAGAGDGFNMVGDTL